MTRTSTDELLSPSDVADVAGVSRPVVSNWRKRHTDFPTAVAGTEANPLFERDAVLAWLRSRGQDIEQETVGSRMWSALNSTRGRISMEDAADLVVLLSTLKCASESAFEEVARLNSTEQGSALSDAVRILREVSPLIDVRLASSVLRDEPSASAVVDAVARTAHRDLADAVDFVLERFSRSQIKAGAECGFIGSRTSDLLASLVGPDVGVVYDPACGIANVLTRVAEQGSARRLIGSDINGAALSVAAQRSFIRHADIDLQWGDVLASDPDPNLRADVVVVEPPFGMHWDPSSKLLDPRFTFGIPPKSSSDLAWVQHAIAHLNPGGTAFVLTSPGAMFRSGAERNIRANLLSAGCVQAIIGLPSKMLPHTSIGPALWVVRRPHEASDVLLIDASDIDQVEKKVAAWLQNPDAVDGIDAPHALVSVPELIAADAALTPRKWVGELAIDDEAIAESLIHSSEAIARTIHRISNSSLGFEKITDLPKPRIVTVRDLIKNGVVELRLGRPDRARDIDDSSKPRIVRASDVKIRSLPPIGELADFTHADLTLAGDVLVTTMSEVRAVVDETGGHLASTGVDRLRILDSSVITPSYLATVITGSWNAHLQNGSTIQRAPIRDLEIPLIPENDQNKVVLVQEAVWRVREQSELLATYAGEAQRVVLDALRYNVTLNPSKVVGPNGHDGHDETGSK